MVAGCWMDSWMCDEGAILMDGSGWNHRIVLCFMFLALMTEARVEVRFLSLPSSRAIHSFLLLLLVT